MQNQTLEGFRLSPQQQRLWSSQQNGYIYCSQLAILITGNLSEKLLKSALQKVINRHEIFRTTFHHRPGVKIPIQVIADISTQTWRNINLSKQKEQELKLNELFQEEKSLISNLENNTLRLFLITLSENQHILLITLPSLCADSWTLKNLLHEIYQAYVSEETGLLEPIQYIQFSEWQNELLEEDAEAGKNYWLNQNLKTQQPLILPFESKIDQTIPFTQKLFSVDLSDYLEKIDAAISKSNMKLSDFLFTCFHILISRLTTQSNIIINTLFLGRKYEEVYETMGLLAQSLPIVSSIDKEFKFSEVLYQISSQISQADKYQEYFTISGGADSSISFDFEELPEEYHTSEVSLSLYKHYVCLDCCKLKLSCLHKPKSLVAQFHYNDNIYTDENIQRLAEQFHTLVNSAASNLETTVGKLEILTVRERHKLLVEFNNTQISYPQDKCIHQLFEQQVEQTPNNIAVVFENQHLTYTELNAKANQLASYLKRLGVEKENIVGLCVERSLDIIIGILAILKAGAAYLPLEPILPKANLAFRLQDVQASILLTQQSLVEKLPADVAQIICLDTSREIIAQEPFDNLQTNVQPENLVYALFTSGSTGKPKAVAVEHRQLVNYLYAIVEKLNLHPGASFATISSFAADLGNTVIFPALYTGGCLHIISQERAADPQALADYFLFHPIDCLKIVPSHLATLMASSPTSSILPRQCLVLGGEASSWDLIDIIHQQAPNCQILNHYGPTETTVGVLTYHVNPTPSSSNISNLASKTVPLGKPLANAQVYILDNQLQPVPFGVAGELYIGGAPLTRGYLNRPELTFERFILNPFTSVLGEKLYKTGDLARYLTDGNIEFVGRIDNQVKIRGFRIELGEIETIFKQHQAIQEVVVLATQEAQRDKRLVAYIVTSSEFRRHNLHSTPINELLKELRNFGKQHLPEYMVPSAFVLLKTLPRTPNGKVDRQALPALVQTHLDLEAQYMAPRTSLEKQLASIWANLLGLEKVGIHDNFFELGGHSLLITQLLAQVRKAFQINLSISSLFEVPTVAGLAAKIENQQTPSSNILATVIADAVLDPTICSNGFTFNHNILENVVLLTGATGFLGAFLLNELLQRTRADIYCLVRANNIEYGKQKIQSSLESYLLWDEKFSQRIISVVGDLSKPLLGLSQEEFQLLASKVDTIYHNGALVNFTYPYSALKAANVLGTQEILRLASQIKLKPVHFISTLGVVVDGEQDSQVPSTGYTQSKWVAEKLVTIARSRGLPISIYRPGRISGSSKTGACNTNDHTFRTIKGCIQLGKVPDRNTTVNISPVDYVSQAIVHLSRQKESLGKIFHLVNPQPAHWRQIVNYIRSYGYPLVEIPESKWQAELLSSKNFEENALYPLISMFTEDTNNATTLTSELELDCQDTLADLATTSINCPPVNQELFNTYFSYLINSGFLQSKNNYKY
ncbi:non-ribosomal peptide synthetase [Dulcicalothrix desertica PCC 7102]|uniref:Non-ribosomal peptide synthetase n=1 Tax=Dulcicalothrix desertica PCC 7102 TaxID=232991 RepID=A0A433VE03_9CYAN|nr:amino acid adenylation domain-containing protein [Dulcicalothrix desertica]RUT04340.1 non-ribosomal peptide synthetase [Dulcicalothrix desertica PCC 7102]TWH51195.1 amino acid adenylation domain-containing protein/thioester reductase-like protein [Dulcicalothrix desertica PCC 7102]